MNAKKQHYVPQYYLKKFANEGQLYLFDIQQNKLLVEKPVDTSTIGYKKNFYDVDPKLLTEYLKGKVTDEKYVDKLVEKYNERISATLIDSFENLGENLHIDKNVKEVVSIIRIEDVYDFILIQLFRTPQFRKFSKDLAELSYKKLEEKLSDEEFKRIKKTVPLETLEKLSHNFFLLSAICETKIWDNEIGEPLLKDEEGLLALPAKEILKKLKNSIGIMYLSRETKLFKTSENPICVHSQAGKPLVEFSFIYVPLTKRCAFLFLDKDEYSSFKDRDKDVQILTDADSAQIDNFNKFLVKKTDRFIFSYDDDFEEIMKFIKGEISLKLEI